MVSRSVIAIGNMAANAKRIAFGQRLHRVWLVTVSAAHAFMVHFALQERSVDIDLFLYLAVVVIETFFQQGWTVAVVKLLAVGEYLFDRPAMRVASRAYLYLCGVAIVTACSLRAQCFRVDDPGSRFGLTESDIKPHVAPVACTFQVIGFFCPGNMI